MKQNKFFEELKAGLEECVAFKKGKITLHSEVIEVDATMKQENADNGLLAKNS